jgi:hypothetical protein
LYFGDRVTVLNDFIYQTGGNMCHIGGLLLEKKIFETYKTQENACTRSNVGPVWGLEPPAPREQPHKPSLNVLSRAM